MCTDERLILATAPTREVRIGQAFRTKLHFIVTTVGTVKSLCEEIQGLFLAGPSCPTVPTMVTVLCKCILNGVCCLGGLCRSPYRRSRAKAR